MRFCILNTVVQSYPSFPSFPSFYPFLSFSFPFHFTSFSLVVCAFLFQKLSSFIQLFIDFPLLPPPFFPLKSWEVSNSWRPDVIRFTGIFYFGACAKEPGPKIIHDYRTLFNPVVFFDSSVSQCLFGILANISMKRKSSNGPDLIFNGRNITMLQCGILRGRIFRTDYSPRPVFSTLLKLNSPRIYSTCVLSPMYLL